ncbi:unnamed protein product [Amoebophrya sp. A120]|nr:unnamed protein product [Amoebophrya sp. A120]|eukprot:GSA120T00007897001.1
MLSLFIRPSRLVGKHQRFLVSVARTKRSVEQDDASRIGGSCHQEECAMGGHPPEQAAPSLLAPDETSSAGAVVKVGRGDATTPATAFAHLEPLRRERESQTADPDLPTPLTEFQIKAQKDGTYPGSFENQPEAPHEVVLQFHESGPQWVPRSQVYPEFFSGSGDRINGCGDAKELTSSDVCSARLAASGDEPEQQKGIQVSAAETNAEAGKVALLADRRQGSAPDELLSSTRPTTTLPSAAATASSLQKPVLHPIISDYPKNRGQLQPRLSEYATTQHFYRNELRSWYWQRKQGTKYQLWCPPGVVFAKLWKYHYDPGPQQVPPLEKWWFQDSAREGQQDEDHDGDEAPASRCWDFAEDADMEYQFHRRPATGLGVVVSTAEQGQQESCSSSSDIPAFDYSEDGEGNNPDAGVDNAEDSGYAASNALGTDEEASSRERSSKIEMPEQHRERPQHTQEAQDVELRDNYRKPLPEQNVVPTAPASSSRFHYSRSHENANGNAKEKTSIFQRAEVAFDRGGHALMNEKIISSGTKTNIPVNLVIGGGTWAVATAKNTPLENFVQFESNDAKLFVSVCRAFQAFEGNRSGLLSLLSGASSAEDMLDQQEHQFFENLRFVFTWPWLAHRFLPKQIVKKAHLHFVDEFELEDCLPALFHVLKPNGTISFTFENKESAAAALREVLLKNSTVRNLMQGAAGAAYPDHGATRTQGTDKHGSCKTSSLNVKFECLTVSQKCRKDQKLAESLLKTKDVSKADDEFLVALFCERVFDPFLQAPAHREKKTGDRVRFNARVEDVVQDEEFIATTPCRRGKPMSGYWRRKEGHAGPAVVMSDELENEGINGQHVVEQSAVEQDGSLVKTTEASSAGGGAVASAADKKVMTANEQSRDVISDSRSEDESTRTSTSSCYPPQHLQGWFYRSEWRAIPSRKPNQKLRDPASFINVKHRLLKR